MNIKKELPGVKENILLKNYTTFKIGGKAKYFFVAKNKEDIIKAILAAKKIELPFFILGGGSNVLVADKGFDGLVIKIKNVKVKIHPVIRPGASSNDGAKSKIYTEAGLPLFLLVSELVKNNLTGLEWAIGIPGTIGGAVYGNAGAFGKSIGDSVRKVEVLDTKDLRFKIYDLKKCKFGYRDSAFKRNKNLIILSVQIQLKKGKKSEIQRKIREYLNHRKETQPLDFPSAGSIFKNYELRIKKYELIKKFPELKNFNKKGQIPAAWLIEKCDLKGKKIGKAKISEKHGNFILNLGGAKAKDVKKLIDFAKKSVKKKFGIVLKEEIQYLF